MEESKMVLESARSRLSALAPIAEEVNKASDAFTEELRTIETELAKLNLGVEVTLRNPLIGGDFHEQDDESNDRLVARYRFDTFLAYGKHRSQSAWRLLVRKYRVDVDSEDDVVREVLLSEKALLEASRELRIAAAGQIDQLLEAITEEAATKATLLRKVTDKK